MKGIVLVLLAAGLAAAAFLVPAQASTPKLIGTVGPGYTITLKKGTAKVKTLTGTSFQGKKTVTVTLKKGSWKFYCSIHEPQMLGFFKVTS